MSNFQKCNIEFSKFFHFLRSEHIGLNTEILFFICDQPEKIEFFCGSNLESFY